MKKLTRSRDEKWIGGVCGGIAAYTGLDATVVRAVVAIATLLGAGSLIVAYVVAWILIPREPRTPAYAWAQASDSPTTAPGTPPPSA